MNKTALIVLITSGVVLLVTLLVVILVLVTRHVNKPPQTTTSMDPLFPTPQYGKWYYLKCACKDSTDCDYTYFQIVNTPTSRNPNANCDYPEEEACAGMLLAGQGKKGAVQIMFHSDGSTMIQGLPLNSTINEQAYPSIQSIPGSSVGKMIGLTFSSTHQWFYKGGNIVDDPDYPSIKWGILYSSSEYCDSGQSFGAKSILAPVPISSELTSKLMLEAVE